MDGPGGAELVPDQIRRVLTLALTIIAALLYALVLGGAVVKTFVEGEPTFTENTVRAAGLLSGLVGSVVTAGFARSRRPALVRMTTDHPLGGRAVTAWSSLRPPSLIRRNLSSLASTLGLAASPSAASPDDEEPEIAKSITPTVWIALLYFVVYFLVGLGAFMLTIWRPVVPDIISNSSWVWLGTIISSSYSFFGLDLG